MSCVSNFECLFCLWPFRISPAVFLWLAYSSSFYSALFISQPSWFTSSPNSPSWRKILYIYSVLIYWTEFDVFCSWKRWLNLFVFTKSWKSTPRAMFIPTSVIKIPGCLLQILFFLQSSPSIIQLLKPETYNHLWFLFPSHPISNPLAGPIGSITKTHPRSIHFTPFTLPSSLEKTL